MHAAIKVLIIGFTRRSTEAKEQPEREHRNARSDSSSLRRKHYLLKNKKHNYRGREENVAEEKEHAIFYNEHTNWMPPTNSILAEL